MKKRLFKLKRIFILTLLPTVFLTVSASAVPYSELVTIQENCVQMANAEREKGEFCDPSVVERAQAKWWDVHKAFTEGWYDEYVTYYTDADVIMLAKLMWGEARGIPSETQIACVAWTVLNRYDYGSGSIRAIVTAPNKYHYSPSFRTVSDYGYDLIALSESVLKAWNNEKNGVEYGKRVIPSDYMWFNGNGKTNSFRNNYNQSKATYWKFTLPSPYST